MAKIAKTKCKQFKVDYSGLKDNDGLVNHLRLLAQDMISCRSQMKVDYELRYSQMVVDDKLGCDDENALEYEKRINQAIDGITSTKRDDAISIHTDLIIGQLNKLFKVSPTPVPDLPKREEDIVVEVIEELIRVRIQENFEEAQLGYMQELTNAGIQTSQEEAQQAVVNSGLDLVPSDEEILEIAQRFKKRALNFMSKRATIGSKKMEKNIHDIMVESDFGTELLKFIHDYNTYPYAVMRKGSHKPVARKIWKGNKWKFEDQMLPVARRVSPHDFYWSSDSLDVNDGLAVGDVVYCKRSDLERMYQFEKETFIKSNIQDCVTQCNSFEDWRNWLDNLGHDDENCHSGTSAWSATATVPIFRIHTCISTCDLEEFGIKIKGKDKLHEYELEAWILNKKVIRFKLHDPKGYKRPYLIEKFRHLPGKFYGKSLPGILRPLEHEIRSTKRNEILNIGFSSAPVVLRNIAAISDEEEIPDIIEPGCNLDVNQFAGATSKPIEFVTSTNITNQLRAVLSDLYAEADIKSQIPRLLTGGSTGSSIRSASMLATQIASASKNLKRQMWLIAHNVIRPYVECVFDWYMLNGDDESAKVDADVEIGSIESLVNREFVLSQIQQLIGFLSPYVQGGLVPPEVLNQLLFTFMSESGITDNTNNQEILDELQGIANDVSSNIGIGNGTSGGPRLDARSNFAPVDTGGLR